MQARRGALVAALLAGAWRETPPPLQLTPAELTSLVPLLVTTRSAALAWWRLRGTPLASHPAAAPLHDAYALHTLQASRHERSLVRAVTALRGLGVEPLLLKGWAVARWYPRPGLRPYLDHDLFVRPSARARAAAALAGLDVPALQVDLEACLEVPWRGHPDVRTRVATVGQTPVQVLAPEDQLRLLCRHALRHGIRRPLWLCDLAVLVESGLPAEFDWAYCLRGPAPTPALVTTALQLAQTLLDARLPDTSMLRAARPVPSWLGPAVLRVWGGRAALPPPAPYFVPALRPGRGSTRARLGQVAALWPEPITSTVWAVAEAERWLPPVAPAVWAVSGASIGRRLLQLTHYVELVRLWIYWSRLAARLLGQDGDRVHG